MKLRSLIAPLLPLLLCGGSQPPAFAAPMAEAALSATPRPNIIFVLVDDMGWGDTSIPPAEFKGRRTPTISTPNLERLADCGVQLRRHYSAAPVCAPARASLFSGVHQGHSEVVRNNSFDAALENSHTLASVLREAGYATALIGKWGIGGGNESGGTPASSAAWPTRRGFDYFFGYHNHLAAHRHYPKEETQSDPDTGCNAIWDGDMVITPALDTCYSTDLFTARAKKWITDHRNATPEKPFFLALTLTAPHARLALPSAPYPAGGGLRGGVQWLGTPGRMINTACGAWDSFIDPAFRQAEPAWLSYAQANFPAGNAPRLVTAALRHATMVARVDAAMGDLLQLCHDLAIHEQTLIIFTSDNGPHNEPGAVAATPGHPSPAQNPAFFRSYGDRDGIKRDLWDGGLRVPCLVYAPGIAQPGSINQTPSQFHDWMATFAELAGVPTPMRCDGVSLLPLLRGAPETASPGIVYAEYAFGGQMPPYADYAPNKTGRLRGEQQAIIFRAADGRYLKAIRTGIRSGEENFEVYDLMTDPHEARNLADTLPAGIQEKLRTAVLYNRRAYDYVRDPAAGKRSNGCGGARVYDTQLVPALDERPTTRRGLTMRQLQAHAPWVPEFDTLPGAKSAVTARVNTPNELELPAGSITEWRGYLRIPHNAPNWHFYLTLDAVPGSKAYMKMHNFQLIDADASYIPGSTATESAAANAEECLHELTGHKGIPLAAGWHDITLVIVQGESAPGRVKLEWSHGNEARCPIPAEAYAALQEAESD